MGYFDPIHVVFTGKHSAAKDVNCRRFLGEMEPSLKQMHAQKANEFKVFQGRWLRRPESSGDKTPRKHVPPPGELTTSEKDGFAMFSEFDFSIWYSVIEQILSQDTCGAIRMMNKE